MTDTTALDTVTAFLSAMESMDIERALTLVDADVEYTNIPLGTVRGHDGVRSVLGPFFAPIDANEFLTIRSATDGPVVFLERLDRHRIGDSWRELPVNSVFEVVDGRITVWRDYFDAGTAALIHAGVTA